MYSGRYGREVNIQWKVRVMDGSIDGRYEWWMEALVKGRRQWEALMDGTRDHQLYSE
jgi:hypothetical protein